ncbi:11059_t:CDS:2, partial [Funneliformis mosseae]
NIRQARKRFLDQQAREESVEVVLAPLLPVPQILYNLLTQNNSISDEPYITQIRAYNQVLTFTFLDVNLNKELANAKKEIYTFRIQ